MIPTEVSGSRFPVGSSQIRSAGWLTTARAIETRCCSPPESSSGRERRLVREADERERLGHLLADRLGPLALHLQRVGDVLGGGAVREQLEVLEDAAEVAAQERHLRVLEARRGRGRRRAAGPRVGSISLRSSRISVDLPEPEAPTTKTNSPLSIVNETSRSATTSGLVDLRHRLEHDHRAGRGDRTRRVRAGLGERYRGSGSEGLVPAPGLGGARAGTRGRTGRGRLQFSRVHARRLSRRPWRAGTRGRTRRGRRRGRPACSRPRVGAVVLDELVRVQHVAPDLTSEVRPPARRRAPSRAPPRAPPRSSSASRERRMRIAVCLFEVWERSFWHWTTIPVGMCVIRTAESVLFTCWPPAPLAR